ncbi:MAG: LytTR family transcriptional regulator DNA-binding domain-containing protein [Croceimicrobium sp.]
MQNFKWRLSILFLFLAGSIIGQKEALVEASLKDVRNPRLLDSLATEMMNYPADSVLMGRAFFLKGLAATYSANAPLALRNFKESLLYLEPGIAYDERFNYEVVLKNLAIAYHRVGNAKSGDSSFLRLQELALAQKDSLKYALAIKGRANGLMNRQSFDSAAVLMREATLILQNLEYRGIASSYLSLGSIYGRIYQEEEALKWFRKALVSSDLLPDKRMRARVYNNMAVALRALNEFDSANYYLQQALDIQVELGSIFDQVEILANLARNHAKLEQWEQASELVNQAWAKMPPPSPRSGRTRSNLWLLSLGVSNNNGDTALARAYLDSLQSQLPYQQRLQDPDLLNAFADYYEKQAQSDSALKYLHLAKDREKELQARRNAAEIKAAANDLEIAALRKQKEGQLKAYQLAIIAVLSFVLIGGLWLRKSRKVAARTLQEKAALNDAKQETAPKDFELIEAPLNLSEQVLSPVSELNIKLKSKVIIRSKDLVYLESDGHYVNLFLTSQKNPEIERTSMKAMEERLKGQDFVRIHRSYLVNIDFLKAVYASKVLLHNGTELPLSRTYKEELKQRFEERPK